MWRASVRESTPSQGWPAGALIKMAKPRDDRQATISESVAPTPTRWNQADDTVEQLESGEADRQSPRVALVVCDLRIRESAKKGRGGEPRPWSRVDPAGPQ